MNAEPLEASVDAARTSRQDPGPAIHHAGETTGSPGIRLLVFTSLYPNVAQARLGLFVEERLRHLVATGRISATVVAPVPWFPFRHPRFGRYSAFGCAPRRELRHGVTIHHPRYPVIPKVGMAVAPSLMVHALLPFMRRLQADGCPFDLIDAHYLYPDGVAAVRIGEVLHKPVVISARGSDVTWIPRHPGPRRQIQRAAGSAAALVAVSEALKTKLGALGVASGTIAVLRNGVDLDGFRPHDRAAARARLGVAGPVWLSVGNLIELKGVHVTLAALAKVPDVTLLLVGRGPEEKRLQQLADSLGVAARVRFLGVVPHAELCRHYNAADALVHASSREGMPNAVLESLACGTPVVAAPFDGAREVVGAPQAGQIAEARTADAICAAWAKLLASKPDPAATRHYAQRFGWAPTVQAQLALYENVLHAWREADIRHGG